MEKYGGITAILNLGITLRHSGGGLLELMNLSKVNFEGSRYLVNPSLKIQTLSYALVQAWKNQYLEARDTLADIRDDPDGVHPTHATLYISLATDPQGPRAALEAALTQRGLVENIIFVSREGLRHMYLARRDYVDAAGEVRDDRENDGIYYDWRERTGVYSSDTDDHRSDSDDCEGMVKEAEKLDWLD